MIRYSIDEDMIRQKKIITDNALVEKYGRIVILSELFALSAKQVHHKHGTTLKDHLLDVASEGVRICKNRPDMTDKMIERVVIAALCHDLGMVGRYEKYQNNFQCLLRHPADSLKIYHYLYSEADPIIEDAILRHMFPLLPVPPKYPEGWILMQADKKCAVRELMKGR